MTNGQNPMTKSKGKQSTFWWEVEVGFGEKAEMAGVFDEMK
jgi:hypothetical protein